MRSFWRTLLDWRLWAAGAGTALLIVTSVAIGWRASEMFDKDTQLEEQLEQERMRNDRLQAQLDGFTQRLDQLEVDLAPVLPPKPPTEGVVPPFVPEQETVPQE